jgi:glycosyltransferase involved in cell wall biosynthesis
MRALVIAPRFPWPSYTGDRIRAATWLEALAPYAEVALVSPPGTPPAGVPKFHFSPAQRSLAGGARRASKILDRLPIQSSLTAPYDWERAIDAARNQSGDFDATIVILSRTDPWVRASLDGGVRILDAVDSLERSASERERAARFPSSWFWKKEAERLSIVERGAGAAYDRIIVVSDEETGEFGKLATAITIGVPIAPLDFDAPRTFDFGFWGRLGYFANEDAARWLIDEIWPAILHTNPSATLAIAGADASRSLRAAARRSNVALFSPVDSMPAFARSVRIALMATRFGSGQSNKVLEAAEAGCALVATPKALAGLAALEPHACVASTARAIAERAIELLAGERARRAMAGRAREVVEARYSRSDVLIELAKIAGVVTREEATA